MTTTESCCNRDSQQQKNNFARAQRFSVHFLAIVARLWYETSYFHGPALRSSWEFKYGTFRFNPEISPAFDKFNEIE